MKGVVGLLPAATPETKAIAAPSAEAIEVHETSRAAEASRSTVAEVALDSDLNDIFAELDAAG